MSHIALFWATFGPVALAVVVALVFEMLDRPDLARWAAAALMISASVTALAAGWLVKPGNVYEIFAAGRIYSTVPGVVLLLAGLALLASGRLPEQSSPALVASAAGGAAIAGVSLELVAVLIGIEIAALSAYGLVSLPRTRRSSEAAVKYFVQGAVATGLFVLGMAVLVGLFSSDSRITSIALGIGLTAQVPYGATFGAMLLVAALAFKSGAAPFHSWAPDAYQTAPPASAAVLAGPVKLAMLSALAMLAAGLASAGVTAQKPFGALIADLFPVIGALAVVSVVVGSTIALTAKSYTRMLAYAGVAQVGYALIALGGLNPGAAVLFASTYALGTTAAFLAADAFAALMPDWDGSIASLAGLGRRAPVLCGSVSIALLSLAGIPPLLGFWGKLQAFAAAIRGSLAFAQAGESRFALWLAVLAAVGIIGSVVSLGYYGNVIRVLFFAEPHGSDELRPEAALASPSSVGRIVVGIAAALIVLGLMPLFVGLNATVSGFLLK